MTDPCAGDFGTVFTFTVIENGVAVDISGATTKTVILVRADQTTMTATPTFVTNGTDGKLQYTTVAGDLAPNVSGKYTFQVMVQLPSGKWYTTAYSFEVRPRIFLAGP